MNLSSKSRSLVLAGLGYVVSIAFLGWEDLTVIITARPVPSRLPLTSSP